jgi:hypothetical protein
MANLHSGIPERIEHSIGNLADSGFDLRTIQDHEIDIGAGKQLFPAIAAKGNQSHIPVAVPYLGLPETIDDKPVDNPTMAPQFVICALCPGPDFLKDSPLSPKLCNHPLHRVTVFFAGAHSYNPVNRQNKYLAVTYLPGIGSHPDFIDHLIDLVRSDNYFNFYFRDEIDNIFGPPVDLRMTFLPAVSFHLADGHPGNADAVQRIFYIIELKRFYYCFDFSHNPFLFNASLLFPAGCNLSQTRQPGTCLPHFRLSAHINRKVTHYLKFCTPASPS